MKKVNKFNQKIKIVPIKKTKLAKKSKKGKNNAKG